MQACFHCTAPTEDVYMQIYGGSYVAAAAAAEVVVVAAAAVAAAAAAASASSSCRRKAAISAPQSPQTLQLRVTHHTSRITRHTSRITHHTSHITHHTSHLTHHTSHTPHHASHMHLCNHNIKLSGAALASPPFNAPSASSASRARNIALPHLCRVMGDV